MISNAKIFSALLMGALMIGVSPAQAQEQNMQGSAPQAQASAANYSDAKLDAYADSAKKISQIHASMAPKIQEAGDKEAQEKMYMQMQKEMAGAVENTDGITVQEYNMISQQAQQNPQLAQDIRSRFQTAQ